MWEEFYTTGEGAAALMPTASIGDMFNGALSATKAVADAYLGYQTAALGVEQQKAAIDLNRTIGQAQVDISRAQAQAAVEKARRDAAGYGYFPNFDQQLANMNARLGMGSTDKTMLWLTVAGVGIALVSYLKKRG